MTFIRQFLPLLLMPLTISIILAIASQIWRRRALMWVAVALLWTSSLPVVGGMLARVAERSAERRLMTDVPPADAIVVLSEGRTIAPGPTAVSEWNGADRFFGGMELFRAGKAPLLVFTGAPPDGPSGAPLEGETLSGYARVFGVPSDRVVTTGPVTNTEEEAREVTALLRARRAGPTRILLVTSAFHMQRARKLFERAGLEVAPFPVDQRGGATRLTVMNFLPSAQGLQTTSLMLREFYGRLFYAIVGS